MPRNIVSLQDFLVDLKSKRWGGEPDPAEVQPPSEMESILMFMGDCLFQILISDDCTDHIREMVGHLEESLHDIWEKVDPEYDRLMNIDHPYAAPSPTAQGEV